MTAHCTLRPAVPAKNFCQFPGTKLGQGGSAQYAVYAIIEGQHRETEEDRMIALEVHICDQRRSYTARFANGDQAVEFIQQRLPSSPTYALDLAAYPYGNHAFYELEDDPVIPPVGPVNQDVLRLLDVLYPTCHHGMSADLCLDPIGPNHWGTAEQERMGLI
jgi:hypothetical protein